MEALFTICGFLGGALLTSIWYTFAMNKEITRVGTLIDLHIKSHPVCQIHQQLQNDLREAEKEMERK